MAKDNPSAAGALAELVLSGANAVSITNALTSLLNLAQAGLSPATLNRLAQVAKVNPEVGNALAGLVAAGRAGQLNFDPGLADRLAMYMRSAAIPAHGTGPSAADNNRALMDGFRALLTAEYGPTIAGAVFLNHVNAAHGAGTALDVATIQATLQAARLAQDTAIAHLNGAQPALLPEARRQAALKAFAEVERAGGFPDGGRAQLYKADLLNVLENVASSAYGIDGTVDGSLLTKIAKQVAEKEFDGKVIEAVKQHLTDTGQMHAANGRAQSYSHSEAVSNMVDVTGIAALKVTYPMLDHLMTTTRTNSAASLNSAFTNLAGDLNHATNPIGNRFFAGRDMSNGVENLTITTSDPHKRGERVMIFDFGPHLLQPQKLVYKPRDVRIDAMLTGDQTGSPHGESMADIVNGLLGPNSVPTYKFLPGPNNESDYGYVEFVSSQSPADNRMTQAQAQNFYREFGRQMAMFTLLGTRDLHHTNMYVSQHRPVFTDLEITLHPEILTKLQNRQGNVIADTQAGMALTSHQEQVRRPDVGIVQDRLTSRGEMATENVLENFVWVSDVAANGTAIDFDNVNGIGALGNMIQTANQVYADELSRGFSEVIDALAGQGVRLDNYAKSLRGMAVRVHPLATGEQLRPLQNAVLHHLGDNDQGAAYFDQSVTTSLGQQGRADRLNAAPNSDNHVADRVKQRIVSDFQNGDVAYFTRWVGNRQLLHDGTTPIVVNPGTGATQFYADDGLTPVRNILNSAATDPTFRTYLKTIGQDLRNTAANGGGTGSSVAYRNALH
jgi:Domain of unknown function (DUF4135)